MMMDALAKREKRAKLVFSLLIAVLSFAYGCAPRVVPPQPPVADGIEAPVWRELPFDESCSADQAETWELSAANDPQALLYGAACAVAVAERADTGSATLDAAERGRRLASAAVGRWPHSAAAHYLLAYATGLVAEQRPLQGLELVPIIEREAQLAAGLDATIDDGGPERMLGDLYLRAPGFPVSIGDSALAVEHFGRAVEMAPDKSANRLGLIEALLAEEQLPAACDELSVLFASFAPVTSTEQWGRAIDLQQRLCGRLEAQ